MKAKKNQNGEVEILIAEDSPTQQAQLEYLLREHGYAVVATANGKEALAAARQRRPALIISDVMMPELDGYGLSKAIKSDEKLKDIPVILVTTLSDTQDVIRGLDCGADNFIRKPYEARYLLSRIEYLLMNLEMRKNPRMQMGIEISLGGERHFITAERQQILDLLISTYEQAVHVNDELKAREKDLAHSNQVLNGLYRIAEGLNRAVSERKVAEAALELALELPGVQAGWIVLREGESGFRLAAVRNLPPALEVPGAMEGDCLCRRQLLAGELRLVTNILDCERLSKAKDDTHGLRYHTSVPLWLGDRTVGVMNLAGPQEGLFDEEALKMLHGVGNQVAVALERARLHEHLKRLVEQRTAILSETQKLFRAIVENVGDLVAVLDTEGRRVYNSPSYRSLFHEEDIRQGSSSFKEIHADDRERIREIFQKTVAMGIGERSEFRFVLRDGSIRFMESDGRVIHDADGKVSKVVVVSRDITERKRAEEKIKRLNRIYAVLSGITTTIVRVGDRQELFAEACRIAVEHGQFRMVWIGLLDPNGEDVTPVAKAGFEEGYLDQILLTARDDVPDSCPLEARALRGNVPIICNDIGADPQMARWREEALQRGYRSLVVFPLVVEDKAVGLFALYASETGFFDSEEMKLLVELAADVSFALDYIEKKNRLTYLAYYDVVTGLPNRVLFHDRLKQHLLAARENNSTVALLGVDLEQFRLINETLGRQAGDALLKQVAERLRGVGLDANHLAYTGVGRFALILDNLQKEADVAHILERHINDSLRRPFVVEGTELRISAKAGIALFPADGADADSLLRNAAAALEKAKLSGDKYLFYTPELNAWVSEKLSLENKLRQAVEKEEFVLHYQPKVDLEKRAIVGVEALIRWQSPELGLVPPLRFMPLLEETGMILEVGAWVLRRAVLDHRHWMEMGLAAPRIAVNVSMIQLRQREFIDILRAAIGEDGGGVGDRSGDHREPDHGQRAGQHHKTASHPGHGHQHRHRRLRHRLFVARLSGQAAGADHQDRPLLHYYHAEGSQCHVAGQNDDLARPFARPEGDCRRRG